MLNRAAVLARADVRDAGRERRSGHGLLSRPAGEPDRRLWNRRRLRRLWPADGAPSRPAYPGPAERRGAEHAGRWQPARRQSPLYHRAQGRQRDRNLRARHAADRHHRAQSKPALRRPQVHLAWPRPRATPTMPTCCSCARMPRSPRSRMRADAGGAPLILGGTGEGSTGNDVPILLRDALGLNIKLIAGYPDGNCDHSSRSIARSSTGA